MKKSIRRRMLAVALMFIMIAESGSVSQAAVDTRETAGSYKETIVGKLQYPTNPEHLAASEVFGLTENDAGFLAEPDTNTGGVYLYYYSLKGGKKKKTAYYTGKRKKYGTSGKIGGIFIKGNKTYVCKLWEKSKTKKLQLVVYKKKKLVQKKSFAASDFFPKKDRKKKNYYFEAGNIYVTGKNTVRVLYGCMTAVNTIRYGGYADINLKTGKITKRCKLSFKPESFEGGYLAGIDNDNYVFAKASTGKVVRKFSKYYGEPKDIKDTENKDEMTYGYKRTHSFQSGKLMFTNTTGIYYASASSSKVEKVIDYKNMNYFQYGIRSRYIQRIIMKNRSEFYISYCDGAYQDSSKYWETIVCYQKV